MTTTAALEADKVKPSKQFPVETEAVIDGVPLENANGESCGGTFNESFAHSCNSVFAPLGVKVGAKRLVEMAERFGWNERPTIAGAQPSTIPAADEIESPLDLGSTRHRPGPGAGHAAADGLGGPDDRQRRRARGPDAAAPASRPGAQRVTSAGWPTRSTRLMVGVVGYGTGTAGAVPGVQVAGKTGTAELGTPAAPTPSRADDPSNTDAWFTAFAPRGKPRIAVAVLFVRNGAGGAVAAPAAQGVLWRALKR